MLTWVWENLEWIILFKKSYFKFLGLLSTNATLSEWEITFELQNGYNEDDGHITLDKFGGDNFNLHKFKLEMVMSTKDLWAIVDGLKLPPPSTASDEVKNTYERRCMKVFAIIATSLVDKELAHLRDQFIQSLVWGILSSRRLGYFIWLRFGVEKCWFEIFVHLKLSLKCFEFQKA